MSSIYDPFSPDYDPFATWDITLSQRERPEVQRQVETDLASGRLHMLDRTSRERCEEVEPAVVWRGKSTAPNQRCTSPAVVHDSERQRRQCMGHGLEHAEDRACGRAEPPLLEAP